MHSLVGIKTIPTKLLTEIFDLVAKAPLLNTKQYDSKYMCERSSTSLTLVLDLQTMPTFIYQQLKLILGLTTRSWQQQQRKPRCQKF